MSRFRNRGKRGTKKSISKRLSRVEKKVARIVTLKTVNLSEVDVTLSTAGDIRLAQINAVEGRKILIRGINFRFDLRQNLSSTIGDDYRVMLLLDKNVENTKPTLLQLFGSATPSINIHLEEDKFSRIKVLREWVGIFEQQTSVAKVVNARIKMNMTMESNTTDTFTQAALMKGALYVLVWTTATSNQPTISYIVQFVYEDHA